MYKNIIVDGHCDTLQKAFDTNLSIFDKSFMFNINSALNNLPYIQFLASYINPKYDKDMLGFLRTNKMLDKLYIEYEKNKKYITIIKGKDDIKNIFDKDKVGILLTIENGSALGNNIDNVIPLYNRGIRVMSLTWNDDNFLACGALSKNDTGLTKIGKKCIKIMNDIGIIIDVSHVSRKSFYDIYNDTASTIIATHSCVDGICHNPRNLTDEQIKIIAKTGGIIGVCFYKGFLSEKSEATIDDVIKHIEYIANLVGTKYIGLGSDFDGMDKEDLPYGINGVTDVKNIASKLEKRGFNKKEIYNIMGGNYIRVLEKNLK